MKISAIGRIMTLLFLGILFATGLGGCSLDKEKGPEIANLVYIPLQAPVDEGKTIALNGTFNIVRKNAETASVRAIVYDAQGKEVSSATIPLSDTVLRTTDTLAFGVDVSTSKKEDYTFQVAVTDSTGRESNRLDGTFAVTDLY